MYTFAHKHTDAKITILTDDGYEAMVSLVSTVQTPSHWVMLDKSPQQPISDKVLYTEEDMKQLVVHVVSSVLNQVRLGLVETSNSVNPQELWENYKKH